VVAAADSCGVAASAPTAAAAIAAAAAAAAEKMLSEVLVQTPAVETILGHVSEMCSSVVVVAEVVTVPATEVALVAAVTVAVTVAVAVAAVAAAAAAAAAVRQSVLTPQVVLPWPQETETGWSDFEAVAVARAAAGLTDGAVEAAGAAPVDEAAPRAEPAVEVSGMAVVVVVVVALAAAAAAAPATLLQVSFHSHPPARDFEASKVVEDS